MRSTVAALALILLPAPVVAQDVVAIAIEGWTAQDRGGTAVHRCASSICADGSVVSYRRQTHRPDLPLAAFEQHHRRLVAENQAAGGRVARASIGGFTERRIDGARVLSARRDVAWSDGKETAYVTALVIGAGATYSVESDARRPDWAVANFEGFLPRIVDIAMLTRP